MSGRRTRSESLWDRKEEGGPETDVGGKIPWQGKEFDSSFHGDGSPKPSNSEANDALMPGDFSHGNENHLTDNDDRHRMKMDPAFDDWENQYASRPSDDLPYRSGERGNMSKDRERSRSRSWSPHRARGRDRDRGRARSRSRDRGGSRFHDEKVSARSKGSDGYRKDSGRNEEGRDDYVCKDYIKGRCRRGASCGFSHHLSQDHRRQSTRDPCKFFLMGNCNRSNCKFSHDAPKSHDNVHSHTDFSDFPKPNRDFDDKNKFWNNSSSEPRVFDESEKNSGFLSRVGNEAGNQESFQSSQSHTLDARLQHVMAETANAPTTMVPEAPGFQKPGEADAHNIVSNQQVHSYGSEFVHNTASLFPSTLNGNENNSSNGNGSGQGMFSQNQQNKPVEKDGLPQNINLANALELLYSLPNNIASSGAIYESTVVGQESNSKEMVVGESVKVSEAIGKAEVNEKKVGEKAKVEEGNDEKAMRQFKIALVEFVKEILKPTWKEGKMSREVYKTIVKKVVDKVTSTIQGNQIPRTQEKIDQYLAFSKSKITKLVEAYVGRFLKA